MPVTLLNAETLAFIQQQRVGRLATADAAGQPHVVPVCYACDGASLFIALDTKPKRVAPERLRRVRNLRDNPRAALVIDHYSDDWSELAYVLVRGVVDLLPPGSEEHGRAVLLLQARYPQYHSMPISEHPVIALRPAEIVTWRGGRQAAGES